MKKALSLALCGVLIFSLAGCGGKQAAEEQSPAASETPVVSETKNSAPESVQSNEGIEKLGSEGVLDVEQQVVDGLDIALSDLTPSQIDLFISTAHGFIDNVIEGTMTVNDLGENQLFILDTYIMSNELPQNARELFSEWKESVNYYELLQEFLLNNGLMEEAATITPPSEDEIAEKMENAGSTVVQQTNKPKPSEKQEQTQKQEVTSKPIKPSNNTPKEEVVGTPGDVVSAGGGNGDNFTKAEDVIGDFDDLMASAIKSEANRIAKEKGISYEEALKLVQSGN